VFRKFLPGYAFRHGLVRPGFGNLPLPERVCRPLSGVGLPSPLSETVEYAVWADLAEYAVRLELNLSTTLSERELSPCLSGAEDSTIYLYPKLTSTFHCPLILSIASFCQCFIRSGSGKYNLVSETGTRYGSHKVFLITTDWNRRCCQSWFRRLISEVITDGEGIKAPSGTFTLKPEFLLVHH
jgi:hypothetical protein